MFGEWVLSHNRSNVTSYRNLKLFIGILGMALPVILVVGGLFYPGHTVQHSVSHYYHTDLRDALVGTLASASILFMTYAGYGIIDDILTWAVGVAGIGVILFPCPTFPEIPQAAVGVHVSCANALTFIKKTCNPRAGIPGKKGFCIGSKREGILASLRVS